MQENGLHKLGKTELLTIIYEQEKQIEQLKNDVKHLNKQLEDRTIQIQEAGSIADASLKINKIFEAAQQAADEYLRSIKEVNKVSQENAEIIQKDITNDKKSKETIEQEKFQNTDEIIKNNVEEKIDIEKIQIFEEIVENEILENTVKETVQNTNEILENNIEKTKKEEKDLIALVLINRELVRIKLFKRIAIFLERLKEKFKILVTNVQTNFISKKENLQKVFKQKRLKFLESKEKKKKESEEKKIQKANEKTEKQRRQEESEKEKKIKQEKLKNEKLEKKDKKKQLNKLDSKNEKDSKKQDVNKSNSKNSKAKKENSKETKENLEKKEDIEHKKDVKKSQNKNIIFEKYDKIISKINEKLSPIKKKINDKKEKLLAKLNSTKGKIKIFFVEKKNKLNKKVENTKTNLKLKIEKIKSIFINKVNKIKEKLKNLKNKISEVRKKIKKEENTDSKETKKNVSPINHEEKKSKKDANKSKTKESKINKSESNKSKKTVKEFFTSIFPRKEKFDVKNIKISLQDLEKELKRRKENANKAKFARTLTFSGVVIVAFTIIAATRIFNVLQVSGNSMEPALYSGDLLISSKIVGYEKGDMIAFYYSNSVLIKRIVATEGDIVFIDDDGNVFVNSKKVEENYVEKLSYGKCDITFPYKVPDKEVFVLGDNRETSIDSRSKALGSISEDKILGKITMNIKKLMFY